MADLVINRDMLEALRFVDKGELVPGRRYRLPDFLLVGPQRTGTTWMSYHLRRHPEVFVPPEKELYFFNNLGERRDRYFRSTRLSWYSRRLVPSRWVFLKKAVVNWARYRVYRPVRLVGEASATYAAMEEELIAEIFALNPDTRIVISVRDPVDRSWSHARLEFKWNQKRDLADVSLDEYRAFYDSAHMHRCADYAGIIDRWQRHARPGNVLVKEFARLEKHPQAFLAELIGFLGLWYDPAFFFTNEVGLSIGGLSGRAVPDEHRALLETLYRDELRALETRYGVTFGGEAGDKPSIER